MRSLGSVEALFVIDALRWTLLLTVIAFTGGGVAGAVIAILRLSDHRLIKWMLNGYNQVFQGIPLLMLMLLCYYGVSLAGIQLSALEAATLALTVNSSAFLGVIWESCLRSIPRAQWESASSLALTRTQTLRFVIAPQAFRLALPSTVGFMVQVVKQTSLASVIGFVEITRAGQLVTNITFEPLKVFGLVGLLYFVICSSLSWLSRRLEKGVSNEF
jgi:polar amino acid transport system permease protein